MTFGNADRFAIDLDTWQGPASGTVFWFANICYRISGHTVGDFQQPVVLIAEIAALEEIANNSGKRRSTELASLSDRNALLRVYEALWGKPKHSSVAQLLDDAHTFSPFWILPVHSEAFQGEKAILLELDEGDKIIWQTFDSERVFSVLIDSGEFDAVLEQVILSCSGPP